MIARTLSQPTQVLGCLAFGGDLSMGQPIDHSPRTALLAWRLATKVSDNPDTASSAATLGLLRWAGCTANAQGFAELFGDDIASRAAVLENRNALVAQGRFSGPIQAHIRPLAYAHCEATVEMARQLGLSSDVSAAAMDVFEHWDGSGIPSGKRREEINLLAQIIAISSDIEIFTRVFGLQKALQLIEGRSGTHYDQALARLVERHASTWMTELSQVDAWTEAALIADSANTNRPIGYHDLANLLADYADLKVPSHFQVSRKSADVTAQVGRTLGMNDGSVDRMARAALLHGLGRVAVPNATLERQASPTEADQEHIRLIPHWTERILKRAPCFASEATLAAQAFERLDGSGFPKGLRGRQISEEARALQSCVFVATMCHDQSCRGALDIENVEKRIAAELRAGRLDPLYADAALSACGMGRVQRHHQPHDVTLHITDREREVLIHLARGLTNKEIARTLRISPSTAGTHVENLYRKLGVSTRAAAALAAMRLDLLEITLS